MASPLAAALDTPLPPNEKTLFRSSALAAAVLPMSRVSVKKRWKVTLLTFFSL
jgi:hypothetical protein